MANITVDAKMLCKAFLAGAQRIEAKKEFLPVTVVSDGRILGKNLKILGKDRAWAEQLLKGKGLSPEDTYLLTVDQKGKTVCIPKDQ